MAHAIQMSKMRWRLVDQKYLAFESQKKHSIWQLRVADPSSEKSEVLKKDMNYDAVVLDVQQT